MACPFKHPKTGMYWLRRRVSADLIPIVGKREELLSLKMEDAGEAKRLHATALVEIDALWATPRVGTIRLTEREVTEIARDLFDRWIELHLDEPSRQTRWRTDLFETPWRPPVADDLSRLIGEVDVGGVKRRETEALALKGADTLLRDRGPITDGDGRGKLAKAVAVVP